MTTANLPLVEELATDTDVMWAVDALSDCSRMLLLESALRRDPVGRYSFLMADPIESWQLETAHYGHDPFEQVRRAWNQLESTPVPGLPPFQGGVAGLAGYELGRSWERIPLARYDEFQLPVMAVGLYDWVIAWDHQAGRVWLISQGWPEREPVRRKARAAARLKLVRERLQATARHRSSVDPSEGDIDPSPSCRSARNLQHPDQARLRLDHPIELARQFPLLGEDPVTSTFSREGYLQAVQRVIDYIHAGDIFQANLSQRLLAPAPCSPVEMYRRLRKVNPAPFAGLLLWDDWAIVSASPERFLCVNDGEVETRPIKGTRPRTPAPEADLFTRDELRQSEKDQAENVMIVDLLRNDLSRVCRPWSVRVPHLCSVESYETVQHLVSEVRGQLKPEMTVWDLFRATFPGGSITGAPKVRAMQIIAELEPTARGPYCGSLFYLGPDGQTDSNLLIRSFIQRFGWLQCNVGGGIVAQSDPEAEFAETLTKAAGMLKAL